MRQKNNIVYKLGVISAAVAITVQLGGCAAATGGAVDASGTETAGGIKLAVKMASSIFLQPVGPEKRVVFIEGHNTSSATGLNFGPTLAADLQNAGYKVTNDPDKAQFMLMYNIRYVGKETKSHTMVGALAGGYGGLLAGAAVTNASHYQDLAGNMAGAGLLGAAIGAGIGYLDRQNAYMMVVDVQLEQRNSGAMTTTTTNASQGIGNSTVSTGGSIKGWQIYRDRIAATAKGRRLAFANAEPVLTHEITHELAGLF